MALGHDIPMGLRAAYLWMHRQTNARLARCEATAEQFVVLSLLIEADGVTQQELVRGASSDPNTIRAMLLRLAERGWVVRGRHPNDGRARTVSLTRKGRLAHKRMAEEIKPVQDRLAGLFREDEAHMLMAFLERISEAMAQNG